MAASIVTGGVFEPTERINGVIPAPKSRPAHHVLLDQSPEVSGLDSAGRFVAGGEQAPPAQSKARRQGTKGGANAPRRAVPRPPLTIDDARSLIRIAAAVHAAGPAREPRMLALIEGLRALVGADAGRIVLVGACPRTGERRLFSQCVCGHAGLPRVEPASGAVMDSFLELAGLRLVAMLSLYRHKPSPRFSVGDRALVEASHREAAWAYAGAPLTRRNRAAKAAEAAECDACNAPTLPGNADVLVGLYVEPMRTSAFPGFGALELPIKTARAGDEANRSFIGPEHSRIPW